MASRAQHCKECEDKLGKPFDEVHRWLDGLASPKAGYLNLNHRRYRHHFEALDEVRKLFGDEAVEAAKLHIITDFGRIPVRAEVEMMFSDIPELVKFDDLFGGPKK